MRDRDGHLEIQHAVPPAPGHEHALARLCHALEAPIDVLVGVIVLSKPLRQAELPVVVPRGRRRTVGRVEHPLFAALDRGIPREVAVRVDVERGASQPWADDQPLVVGPFRTQHVHQVLLKVRWHAELSHHLWALAAKVLVEEVERPQLVLSFAPISNLEVLTQGHVHARRHAERFLTEPLEQPLPRPLGGRQPFGDHARENHRDAWLLVFLDKLLAGKRVDAAPLDIAALEPARLDARHVLAHGLRAAALILVILVKSSHLGVTSLRWAAAIAFIWARHESFLLQI